MRCFETIAGLQTYLTIEGQNKRIGFVPTMGALHQGHASLITKAVEETDLVVVSIFVNPLQFGPQEDLSRYPRSLDADCQMAETLGVAVVFAPTAQELGLVSQNVKTLVVPPIALTETLCGQHRPGHFSGVATIVSQLFNIVRPGVAYFGEKDAQQLAIIRHLAQDLHFPLEIKSCPTVRDATGLALSSRNQYLSSQERQDVTAIYRGLQRANANFLAGERDGKRLLQAIANELASISSLKLQYLELVDPQNLQPLERIESVGLIALAAYVGSTRLIDNLLLRQRQPIIAIDGPAGAGKSTVTRQVADRLGLIYLDTGALYRAIAWLVLSSGVSAEDAAAVAELVSQAQIELIPRPMPQLTGVKVHGQDISNAVRTPEVTQLVSAIAAQKAVRDKLLEIQRRYGDEGGLVAEGRDIGTHVFPDAELKIFLTASVAERARRRYQDFLAQGKPDIDLAQLEKDIAQRDYLDSTRDLAPLKRAIDAIEVETDHLTIEAVIAKILALYNEKRP